ncbi:hypothetical protein PLESTB_000770000 [Pleodorina starrii]|uniref:SnoaL-like domain-containing protein n=1 Tax=Pleodorina starrii TaxID=330485 RepID=A0A9W6F2A4_9CHLO|nr:hypothetical protein PLESTM_000435100 [Pleodorina starrii]GLC53624.1 hypothetical protein PLESTB_000770000 [Pleodorina starrii]GLC65679.1 hypothetical protein PLESTF_000328200 [Pleodorina starrii]
MFQTRAAAVRFWSLQPAHRSTFRQSRLGAAAPSGHLWRSTGRSVQHDSVAGLQTRTAPLQVTAAGCGCGSAATSSAAMSDGQQQQQGQQGHELQEQQEQDREMRRNEVALRVASDYMRLSVAASLEQVYGLFAADAAYRSDALGSSWSGLQSIRGMMDGFFTRFPDVRWEVTSLRVVDSSEPRPAAVKVAVEFIRYWTSEAGESVRRTGREWIYVDPETAKILYVHVAPLDP